MGHWRALVKVERDIGARRDAYAPAPPPLLPRQNTYGGLLVPDGASGLGLEGAGRGGDGERGSDECGLHGESVEDQRYLTVLSMSKIRGALRAARLLKKIRGALMMTMSRPGVFCTICRVGCDREIASSPSLSCERGRGGRKSLGDARLTLPQKLKGGVKCQADAKKLLLKS